MKRILLAATLLATPALAQDEHSTKPPPCISLTKAKAAIEQQIQGAADEAHATHLGEPVWTELTPAQLVWAMGVFVGAPGEPQDVMPIGDGAIMVHRKGMMYSAVVWTTKGKLSCGGFMPLDPKKTALIDGLKNLKALSELSGGGDQSDAL